MVSAQHFHYIAQLRAHFKLINQLHFRTLFMLAATYSPWSLMFTIQQTIADTYAEVALAVCLTIYILA
jgi:hypothetical protein